MGPSPAEPDVRVPHPLRGLRRHRLLPGLGHLHRAVLALHGLRCLGGQLNPGLRQREPVGAPTRHPPRRHPGPERADLRPGPPARNPADAAHPQLAGPALLPAGQGSHYPHIDALFSATVDWDLIETLLPDMLRVALSVKAGLIRPSAILRRLSTFSRKNKLYFAFRELGRVVRTIFLYVTWNLSRSVVA